jgi:ankyrin repeat protein
MENIMQGLISIALLTLAALPATAMHMPQQQEKNSWTDLAVAQAAQKLHTNPWLAKILPVGLRETIDKYRSAREPYLIKAAQEGNIKLVTQLLDAGVNINARTTSGMTALMWAAHQGHTQVVRALLQRGADVNTKDVYGNTALMDATGFGHTEVVRDLLNAGADATPKDTFGRTALDLNTNEEIKKLLRAKMKSGNK